MRLAFNIVLVALIILLMAFAMVSCVADTGPSQINLTADPYLGTIDGIYNMNLTASVSDASGNPVADGTLVDFTINTPGGSSSGTSIYDPIITGNLNSNNSRFASVLTMGGKAVAHYGWFPDNKIPTGYVTIAVSPNSTPSVKSTYYLQFNGTTQILWTLTPVVCPVPPSPIPSSTPIQTPGATQSPMATPMSLMVTLLSLTIGATIVLAARTK